MRWFWTSASIGLVLTASVLAQAQENRWSSESFYETYDSRSRAPGADPNLFDRSSPSSLESGITTPGTSGFNSHSLGSNSDETPDFNRAWSDPRPCTLGNTACETQ